ncbi:MAG TPA: hypothetical protein VN651_12485 [Gemmatimonadaceae bacterium]|nr:hypothetical protein [Gemmatimonadaceae bacterium]
MSTSQRSMQEQMTSLSPSDVLARAKTFFATRPSIYSTFIDKQGPGFCSFRGQGGEEIVIAATAAPGGGSRVTGSTYLFDMQIARFFSTLPPAAGE